MLDKHQKNLIKAIKKWLKDCDRIEHNNNFTKAMKDNAAELLELVIEFFDSND